MRELAQEIIDDLPQAMFTAAAVGIILCCLFVWSGLISGVF